MVFEDKNITLHISIFRGRLNWNRLIHGLLDILLEIEVYLLKSTYTTATSVFFYIAYTHEKYDDTGVYGSIIAYTYFNFNLRIQNYNYLKNHQNNFYNHIIWLLQNILKTKRPNTMAKQSNNTLIIIINTRYVHCTQNHQTWYFTSILTHYFSDVWKKTHMYLIQILKIICIWMPIFKKYLVWV